MKQRPAIKPESELAKSAARALKRAAQRSRCQYGTPIHVQSNGTVVAIKP